MHTERARSAAAGKRSVVASWKLTVPPAAACVCVCVCVSCSNSTTFRTRFWRRLAASWQSVCVENAAALVVQRIETLTLTPTLKAVAILEHSLCVTVQFNTCVTDCVWASICVCSLSLSQCVCAFSLSVCVWASCRAQSSSSWATKS